MSKYYHGTSRENALSIVKDRKIKKSIEGIVYLAESVEDAVKFNCVRCWDKPIFIFELEGLDESKIEEQFDHSFDFFQAKAFGYEGDIDLESTKFEVYVNSPDNSVKETEG